MIRSPCTCMPQASASWLGLQPFFSAIFSSAVRGTTVRLSETNLGLRSEERTLDELEVVVPELLGETREGARAAQVAVLLNIREAAEAAGEEACVEKRQPEHLQDTDETHLCRAASRQRS